MTVERTIQVAHPIELRATLLPLRRGTGDPVHRMDELGRFWRACSTPAGDGTIAVSSRGTEVTATAWGPGADWLLDGLAALVGGTDDWSGLDLSAERRLADVRRRRPGVRLTSTGLVLDALVPAILEQKVTGQEARRAWRGLVYRFGRPAPGPAGLRVPPSPRELLAVPTWDWHRLGVDLQRQRTIRAVATVANRLEEGVGMTPEAARARLQLVPGVGAWTAAETAQRAFGDPDAVSVGDFHLANWVVHFLTGRSRGTDAEMLELLEPWRGQRQRVVRLIELSGVGAPRFGPRFSPTDVRAI